MSEKHISSRALFASLAVGSGILLAGCGNKTQNPEIGDTGVAKEKIEAIIDYNQIKIPKDTCDFNSGENFTIIDKDQLRLGSKTVCYEDRALGEKQCYPELNIEDGYQLQSKNCTAWIPRSEVNKATDLDKK